MSRIAGAAVNKYVPFKYKRSNLLRKSLVKRLEVNQCQLDHASLRKSTCFIVLQNRRSVIGEAKKLCRAGSSKV